MYAMGYDGGAAETRCGGFRTVVSPTPYWLTTVQSGVCTAAILTEAMEQKVGIDI